MILRRLTDAFRKQDWFTVLIETLIVVFGVFLGIQLGNWNDDRVLTSSADQARQELIEDLRRDIATFNVRREFYADVLTAALNVESQLGAPPNEAAEAQWLLVADVHETGFMWPLQPSGLVYRELKNAGKLRLIADASLQKDLRDYYEDTSAELGVTIQFDSDFRDNSRRLIDGAIHVHFGEKCDDFELAEPSTPDAYDSEYFTTCAPPDDMSSVSNSYERLLAAPHLADDLRLRISEISQTLTFLSWMENQANDLVLELEADT